MSSYRSWIGLLLVAGMLLTACGGAEIVQSFETLDGSNDEATDDGGALGGATAGPVTGTAEPGQAIAEVDGQTIVYNAAGSLHYRCDISDDRIAVNYQTPEGHDLLINGSTQGNGWIVNMTFKSGATTENVQYSADVADGTVGLDSSAFSYEGPMTRVEDFDLQNATDMQGSIVVNCATPGGDPTAEIGGTTFTFPLSGAQSVTCEVTDTSFDVMINRLALEDLQLEMFASNDGQWLGHVAVYSGDDLYIASIPADGTGLAVDGGSITFEGTFVHTSNANPDLDEELEGTATITCS